MFLFYFSPVTLEYSLESLTCSRVTSVTSVLTGTVAFLLSAPIARQNYLAANVQTVYLTKWSASVSLLSLNGGMLYLTNHNLT